MLAADDGNPATVAPIHAIDAGLRQLVEATYRTRGGRGVALPGAAAVSGRGRVDMRFAVDNDGEIYILTKSDGMIRQVVGAAIAGGSIPTTRLEVRNPSPAKPAERVAPTPESIAAGKKAFDANCAACHGDVAQGAQKAGIAISIIEEQGGKQAPDLTDDKWDHGSTDVEIHAVIKKGIPPTMMAAYDGRLSDADIWNIVNYIRSLARRP